MPRTAALISITVDTLAGHPDDVLKEYWGYANNATDIGRVKEYIDQFLLETSSIEEKNDFISKWAHIYFPYIGI
ncbi:hypothetical protein [Paenibacillus sp. Soil766]|uniref:hypothetical protein n=1 Tax=Paenibacillus sp. Soil766 TaxID=1736404 RepID=UPI0012FAEBB4|nr:hypothetical protein [Paenibacillus sp. Soil766]